MLLYNIDFELAAIVFLVVLNIYIRTQYNSKSENNRRFQILAVILLGAVVLDVVTAITISYGSVVHNHVNILLNTLYFACDAVLGYQFIKYVIGIVEDKLVHRFINSISFFMLCGVGVVLAVNLFSGVVFGFDENGQYIHGSLYGLVFIVPLMFIFFSSISLMLNFRNFTRNQRISCALYMIVTVTGCVVQLMFPDVLMILFTVSLGFMMLMFSMETPDYQAFRATTKELENARDKAEEAMLMAQSADKAKTDFLTGVSHEIRTPINAILGYNELIMKENASDSVAEYSVNVNNAGKALLAMISSIIDFTEIQSGNISIEHAPYNTASAMKDVVYYIRYHASEKGLEIRLNISSDIPSQMFGDCVKIKQILYNLISNAVKYTDSGFIELGISWQPDGDRSGILSAYVKDSGIGIKEEDIEKLASAFNRIDKKRNRNIQGIGVGLAIVSGLLSRMGSELKVESEYGAGTTFSFDLKQDVADNTPVGELHYAGTRTAEYTEDSSESFIAPDVRILAVDDNKMNLDLLCRILACTKATIDTAENGVEALSLINRKKYHLIFLDHMMPVMDGIETINTIKKQGLCPDVPIIVLTANAVAGEKALYLNAGFDDYLSKPVSGAQLLEMLKKYLPSGMLHSAVTAAENTVHEVTGTPGVQKPSAAPATLMERLSFLDTKKGMEFCCNDEEFYVSMIQSYIEGSKYDEIQSHFDSGNYSDYRILVHAVKGNSRTIGAAALGDEAEKLEKAQKEGNTDYILANHAEFMVHYGDMLNKLKAAVEAPSECVPEKVEEVTVHGGEITEEDVIRAGNEQEADALVLVVDDDPVSRFIAENMLGRDYEVFTVSSASEAMRMLDTMMPDLILLDLYMPEMTGAEFIRLLKADPRTEKIPVIFTTADDDAATEVRCIERGADDFVVKPLVREVISARIRRIIRESRLSRDLSDSVNRQTARIEKEQKAFERLSVQTMRSLADAIDAKDKFTSGHSLRVAQYSREIARRCGKSEKEQDRIYYTALLHDIGKIGVPDELINKTDDLSPDEFERIKIHAENGHRILRNVSEIPEIARGARWHHERYDGGGYPDGLSGADIPEEARIICVADAYDSMTSNRSYRNICTREFARSEIESGIGTQFDPVFAKKMLDMIDEDVDYRMKGVPSKR